jgi:transketolase
VFGDKSLVDMCLRAPRRAEDMLGIYGMGERKYEKYGAAFFAVIDAYRADHPELAADFERRMQGDLLPAFAEKLPEVLAAIAARPDAFATRKASQNALDALAPLVPEFFGGSADLYLSWQNLLRTSTVWRLMPRVMVILWQIAT